MKAWIDLLPGWPADEVAALARAGHRVVVDARPRGLSARVAVRVAGDLDGLEPGDVALGDAREGIDLGAFAAACRARRIDPWAVVATPRQVAAARSVGVGAWLRGQEAGGPVAEYTALVLIRAAAGGRFVVEGLGRRAMAASVAVGAEGIVLGAHLWGTRNAPLHEAHRAAVLGATDGRDTAVLGVEVDRLVRVLSRGSIAARTVGDVARRGDPEAFAHAVASGLESWAARPEALVPAPQCVAEAAAGAGRDAVDATRTLVEDVRARVDTVRHGHPLTAGRDPLGCGHPIVCGPMANVAESPDLAVAVAGEGGMPFAALGALDPTRAREVATAFKAAVHGPWGLGIIGFEVMPHRDAHLAIARDLRPGAVTLAGGSVELALSLQADGLAAWLHTPSGVLAARALQRGVAAVILEGHEAGGHVGALTSAGLWEEGLAAAETAPGTPIVVLAGGIGDATSAAFAAAMGAQADRRGVRVVLQAGTAFLLTTEALAARQVTPAYHAAALAADRTELVGATVNLPLRCAPNHYVTEARALERTWLAEGVGAAERRHRVEHHNLGRTRIAAKGIERHPEWGVKPGTPKYRSVERVRQDDEGAFTLGQGTVVTDRIAAVAEVVAAMSAGARAILDAPGAKWGPVRGIAGDPSTTRVVEAAPVRLRRRGEVAAAGSVDPAAPIAVVGLGCVVPGALDVPALWDLLVRAEDAVDDIPRDRWEPERYWDPEAGSSGPVKTYSRMAGAVRGFAFDPLRYKIPPRVAATMDPAQRLTLAAAEQAVRDAGWLGDKLDKRRAAVILGNSMGGEYAKALSLRVRFREVVAAVEAEGGFDSLDPAARAALSDRVEARLARILPPVDVDSMAGLLSNVIAGRVTMWLDWMGGNMTVDAACAASLAALSVAVEWLRHGRCDAVLTGGVDTDLSAETYVAFARTEALSTAGSRPFGADADGFVMGEGCGVFALKRLDDALRDGDAVWAVIRGVGQSSDGRGRGITAPRDAGQKLAMDRAYAEAGLAPRDVGLVEAHGTGTHLGDRTEVGVLREVFAGGATPTWLGSVKSNLGHLKGAAGSAGLLKAILSVATGIVPPTIHAGPVNADLRLGESPLRLPMRATPFPDRGVRRAAVSAFGFGGTNFHVIVEEPPPEARRPEAIDALRARAEPYVETDAIAAAWPLGEVSTPAVPVAPWLLVPGQGAQRDGAVASVRRFPAGAAALDALEALLPAVAAGIGLPDVHRFDGLEGGVPDTRRLHLLLYGLAVAWAAVWKAAGAPLAGAVGHSLGEYGALVAAGRLDPVDGLRLVAARGAALHACGPGAMLAVAMPEAEATVRAHDAGLALAAVNGPAACVLAGAVEAVESLAHDLAAEGISATRLAVDRAFHSPLVAPAADALAQALADVVFHPGLPVISGATGAPFGDDPADDLVAGLLRPVRFADAVAAAAPSLAIEAGPGRTLSRLAETAVRGVRAVPLDPKPGGDGPWKASDDLARAGRPELRAALGPAPAPEAPTVRVVPAGEDPVRDAVVAAIHDVTGYPVEYLAEGVDLEGDLGVDSIRKMEVLGLLQERLGFAAEESDYADLARARLEDLVAYAKRRLEAGPTAAPAERAPARAWATLGVPLAAAPPVDEALPDGVSRLGEVVRWVVAPTGRDPVRLRAVVAEGLSIARDPAPFARLVVVGADGDPGFAAAAALARSVARERGVDARAVADAGAVPARIAAEVAAEGRPASVRVDATGADALHLVPTAPEPVPLPDRPVVLATGGARGIALACLAALAEHEPRVVLLGRTPPPPDAFEALSRRGVSITWRRCDVTSAADVLAAVEATRALHGRIDVVLHAAGALADGPAAKAAPADVDVVFGPKVSGALHLAAATAPDAPALWIAFSSIAAHLGNPGQAVYAAANAALEALPHPTAARSLTLAWTAWREVGMAASPGVQALLASRGVTALDPSEGGRVFHDLLGGSGTVVVSADPPPPPALPWPLEEVLAVAPRRSGRFRVALDPAHRSLADHVVGGRPLVPAAVWVTAMVAAARLVRPSAGPWTVEAFAVRAPTFVEAPRDAEIAVDDDAVQVVVRGTVVASARVVSGDALADTVPPSPLRAPRPADALYRPDLLFHGPAWQVLDRVEGDGNGGVLADVLALDGLGVATAVDAAHQVLSAWAGQETGWLGLPVGGTWVVADGAVGPLRLESDARVDDDGVVGEIVATDLTGRIVLIGRDVRLRRASRWPDDAPDVLGGPS